MTLPLRLDGRTALVCGASSGIGRATALVLAGQGAQVTVLARREDRLRALLAVLPGEGHALAVADLDRPETLPQADFDIIINNTGGPPGGPMVDAAPDALAAAFTRHVLAAHRLVQASMPRMRAKGWGRVVNVLSTSVREPIPDLGVSNTVRAAMAGWAKSMANEMPPGVTINNVLPGYTATERLEGLAEANAARRGLSPEMVRYTWIAQVPEGRLIRPEETAWTIAFLCSDAAGAIRGQSLAVDGGRLRSI